MSQQSPDKTSDPNNRMRLLHAATDAFAEHGYEGASLRSIADDAGASFQLITHYFGSKEDLWVATAEYLYERYMETGKGLGFTPSGNIYEQFHNHLRLLLTDMLQRPQMRKIWIQEYFAASERYTRVIKPQIESVYRNLAQPYYEQVVGLGIVKKYTAEEVAMLFSSVIQNNVVYPFYMELLFGFPAGSAKSVERQVDLLFGILTEGSDVEGEWAAPMTPESAAASDAAATEPDAAAGSRSDGTVVYPWNRARDLSSPAQARIKQLEMQNRHLKQLVGEITLEKKALVEMLAAQDGSTAPSSKRKDRDRS